MSKFLISTTETYRADTEFEAQELIENAKQQEEFELTKYTSEKKERTSKGEIIDEWIRVTLTKKFCDEKEPGVQASVSYEVNI